MMTLLEETLAAATAERAAILARRARKRARFDKVRFYSSGSWRALRYATLRKNRERYGVLTCEVCKSTDGPFHCDHIEPLSLNWDRRLDPSNVQIMCDDCNLGKGNRDRIDWRPTQEEAVVG